MCNRIVAALTSVAPEAKFEQEVLVIHPSSSDVRYICFFGQIGCANKRPMSKTAFFCHAGNPSFRLMHMHMLFSL